MPVEQLTSQQANAAAAAEGEKQRHSWPSKRRAFPAGPKAAAIAPLTDKGQSRQRIGGKDGF